MDSQIIAFLIGLAGVSILPLVTFGTKLLINKAEEAVQKAKLAKLGMKGDSLALGEKNAGIAILATNQVFKNKPTASNDEKKIFGMDMLRGLNEEVGIEMSESTMSALIEAGVWVNNNPVAGTSSSTSVTTATTETTTTSTPTLDQSLPPEGLG